VIAEIALRSAWSVRANGPHGYGVAGPVSSL
jgi:hypothetical protein